MRLALPCVLLVHENEHDTKNTNARKGTGEPQSFDPKTYLPSSSKAVAEQAVVKVRDSTELKQICLPAENGRARSPARTDEQGEPIAS